MYQNIREDNDYRISQTPFGEAPGEPDEYIGTAVPWKGKTGSEFWDLEDKHVGEEGVGLVSAIKKAIKVSKGCAGTTGTTVKGGRVLPQKVVCQMEKAEEILG